MIRSGTIDTPTWHAVIIVIGTPADPVIRCIGFKRARDRDHWLAWFTASVGALADAVPVKFCGARSVQNLVTALVAAASAPTTSATRKWYNSGSANTRRRVPHWPYLWGEHIPSLRP